MSNFDRYVAGHDIPGDEWPEAFARWIAAQTGAGWPFGKGLARRRADR